MELVLLMYNTHPYFSLKNVGKKSMHYTQQYMVHIPSGTQDFQRLITFPSASRR